MQCMITTQNKTQTIFTEYFLWKLFSKLITEIYLIHANTFQFFRNHLLLYIKVEWIVKIKYMQIQRLTKRVWRGWGFNFGNNDLGLLFTENDWVSFNQRKCYGFCSHSNLGFDWDWFQRNKERWLSNNGRHEQWEPHWTTTVWVLLISYG